MRSYSARGSLERNAVIDMALEQIDRRGLDAFAIRRLAEALDRPPMTLYSHFESKRQLLDSAFDRLVTRLLQTSAHHATWQHQFEDSCRHMRRELLAHPHWIALLTRVTSPEGRLPIYDRWLDLLRKDGFRPQPALFALSSVLSHTLGAVLHERMMMAHPPIPVQRFELVKRALAEAPPGSFPRVAKVSSKFEHCNFDTVFDVGLRTLIAGFDETPRRQGQRRRGNARAQHGVSRRRFFRRSGEL